MKKFTIERVFGVSTMVQRGPGDRVSTFPFGHEAHYLECGLHREPYTQEDAQVVAAWQNGHDMPLVPMVAREHDLFDPARRRNEHAARQDGQRRGLTPIRDSK